MNLSKQNLNKIRTTDRLSLPGAEDEWAEYYSALWSNQNAAELVDKALSNQDLWNADLSELPGFVDSVKHHLRMIESKDTNESIKLINKGLVF